MGLMLGKPNAMSGKRNIPLACQASGCAGKGEETAHKKTGGQRPPVFLMSGSKGRIRTADPIIMSDVL